MSTVQDQAFGEFYDSLRSLTFLLPSLLLGLQLQEIDSWLTTLLNIIMIFVLMALDGLIINLLKKKLRESILKTVYQF